MADLTPLNSDPSLAPSSRRSTGTSHSGLDYYFQHAPAGSVTPGSPGGMHLAGAAGAGAHNGLGGGSGSASRPGLNTLGGVSAFSSSSSLGVPLSPSVYAQARRQESGESQGYANGHGDGIIFSMDRMDKDGNQVEEIRPSLDSARVDHKSAGSPIPSPGLWSSSSSNYSFGAGAGGAGYGYRHGDSASSAEMTSPAVQVWANDAAAALQQEADLTAQASGGDVAGSRPGERDDLRYPINMPSRSGTAGSGGSSYQISPTSPYRLPASAAAAGAGVPGGSLERTPVAPADTHGGRVDPSQGAALTYGTRRYDHAGLGIVDPAKSPSGTTEDNRTPTMQNQGTPTGTNAGTGGPSPSRYTPSSGRPVFALPTSPSARQDPRGYEAAGLGPTAAGSTSAYKADRGLAGLGMGPLASPSSGSGHGTRTGAEDYRRGGSSVVSTVAAVGQDGDGGNDFGPTPSRQGSGDGEDTLKAKERGKRSTLPDVGHLSPALNNDRKVRGGSPVPPPRSTLRNQLASLASPIPNLDLYSPPTSRPTSQSTTPPSQTQPQTHPHSMSPTPSSSQPILVHAVPLTSSSASTSSSALLAAGYHQSQAPPRLDRGLSKDSTTISDLAALLGGAIDEIGLIDSRETPPPMVGADPRDKINAKSPSSLDWTHPATVPRSGSEAERGFVESYRLDGAATGADAASTTISLNDSSAAPMSAQTPTMQRQPSRPDMRSSPRGSRPYIPGRTDSLGGTPILAPTTQPVAAAADTPHAATVPGVKRTQSSGGDSAYSALTNADAQKTTSEAARSRSSIQSKQTARTSVTVFEAKPWPAAMLYGHIRNMKHAGDRAKAYARGINELARADTGLMDWCAMSISVPHKPLGPRSTDKLTSPSIRISSYSTHQPQYSISSISTVHAPGPGSTAQSSNDFMSYHHPRTVSASSEFPMRDDHQTAREISQRVIDPAEPTGLPPNLPYPQIQQLNSMSQNQRSSLHAPSGMRASPSTHSIAGAQSVSGMLGTNGSAHTGLAPIPTPAPAPKRGFFSALRSRKDPGLGPPTGVLPASGIKDLAISGPGPASAAAVQAARNGSISAPIGPRAQSTAPGGATYHALAQGRKNGLGDDTTPTRASFDIASAASHALGYARAGNRGSLDSARMGAGVGSPGMGIGMGSRNGTPRGSVDRTGSGSASPARRGTGQVDEQDVRAVSDVLPHVEKGVVRAYLGRYGDQMTAISAYLEDERRGTLLR